MNSAAPHVLHFTFYGGMLYAFLRTRITIHGYRGTPEQLKGEGD